MLKQHLEAEVLLQLDIGFEQNKKVFCIPRNLGEIKGAGTNELIQKGATLVTSPNDILREFGIKVSKENNYKMENLKVQAKVKQDEKQSISKEYIDIYNFIPYYPVTIEYLARKSNLRISEINQKLTILELEGLIKSLPGNNYVRS